MKRDDNSIIVQPEGYQLKAGETYTDGGKTYKEGDAVNDGGDSAFSTGLNAWAGSKLDHDLMPLFIKDGKLVRHPTMTFNTGTHPHNDPRATSRDQVLAFFSGLQSGYPMNEKVREACLNYAKSWTVNKDILSPANRVYLYRCAGAKPPKLLETIAHPVMCLEFTNNTKWNTKHEMNQFTVMCSIYGNDWLLKLYKAHPDLFGNLTEYFSGWRQRGEIALNMIARVKRDLKL